MQITSCKTMQSLKQMYNWDNNQFTTIMNFFKSLVLCACTYLYYNGQEMFSKTEMITRSTDLLANFLLTITNHYDFLKCNTVWKIFAIVNIWFHFEVSTIKGFKLSMPYFHLSTNFIYYIKWENMLVNKQ